MTVNRLEAETTKIKNFTYDPEKSINLLLNAVQEHADLLKIAGAELQDSQIQKLAYLLISKYHLFQDALISWNKLPHPKTWDTMKTHMRDEYQMLKDVNAITIQDSALHTTNIVNELKNQQETLLYSAEQRFKTNLTEVMNMAVADIEDKAKPEVEKHENINNAAEIIALKEEVKKLYSQLNSAKGLRNNTNYGQNRSNNRYQNNSRNFKGSNTQQRQFYCWTHGAGHSGWNCRNPADGHRPEATFNNRMGGNNFGCFTTKPRRFNYNNQYQNRNQNQPTTNQSEQNQN